VFSFVGTYLYPDIRLGDLSKTKTKQQPYKPQQLICAFVIKFTIKVVCENSVQLIIPLPCSYWQVLIASDPIKEDL